MGGSGSGRKATVRNAAPKGPEVDEIVKCGKDPVYFTNKYCKIQHPLRGTIPFKTYEFQDDCLRDFAKHPFNIVLKSRQLGLSTVTAAYAVWLAIFRRDKNILVIATKLRTAMNFIKKVRKILACLPGWMRITDYEESRNEVRFSNGSQIVSIATTEDAGRSEALSLLIVDEAAFVRNFDEIWSALFPTLSEGGGAIVMSTPNGVGGQYYDLWMDALSGKNGFNPIKLMWDVHPEHDEAYYEKMYAKLGPRKSAQELLCDFLSSGETFLQQATMSWVSSQTRIPAVRDGQQGTTWVWAQPDLTHKYLLSSDVSRGDAKDYSTFVIIDMATGEIVVEYRDKVFPDVLAEHIDHWGRMYNKALVVVESNAYGHHTLTELIKKKYTNIFYPAAPKHSIENYYPTSKDKPGFNTLQETRLQALARFEDSLRTHAVIPHSTRLYDELQTFVWIDEKPRAKNGKHDDLIMATAIGCWVYRTYFESYRYSFVVGYDGKVAKADLPLFVFASKSSKQFVSPADEEARRRRAMIAASSDRNGPPQPILADQVDIGWLLR